jgi:ribosome-binding protein aMBF1 (putative translation factor)
MPFTTEPDIKEVIRQKLESDPEFKKAWEESRTEYRILGELISIRKQKGLSQTELAALTGNKQQVISRIETKENSPTLKTLCGILNVLDYDILLVPKHRTQYQVHETEEEYE